MESYLIKNTPSPKKIGKFQRKFYNQFTKIKRPDTNKAGVIAI